MKIPILLFGTARLAAGRAEMEIELRPGATVRDAFSALAAGIPGLAPMERSLRFAVDMEYADAATPLREGQTLALIPPVQGG